jgi:hypothetical protein
MNQEILKAFWNQGEDKPDKLHVHLTHNNEDGQVISEIYCDDKFVAFIRQEFGKPERTLVFPGDDCCNVLREIGVDWLLKAITISSNILTNEYSKSIISSNCSWKVENIDLEDLHITFFSDIDYDHLVAELYYINNYIAYIHQDFGKSRTILVFPEKSFEGLLREFDVDWFLSAVISTRDTLIDGSFVPDIIEKPTWYEDKYGLI